MPKFVAFDHLPTGDDPVPKVAIGPGSLLDVQRVNFASDLAIAAGASSLGRNVIDMNYNGPAYYTILVESTSLVIYGVRCYLLSSGTVPPNQAAGAFLKFESADGTSRLELRWTNGSTAVDVYANGDNVGSFTMAYAQWAYLEVAFKASATTAGWVNIHLDGVEVLKESGIQTVSAVDIDHVKQHTPNSTGPRSQFTDIYVNVATDDVDAPGFYGPILMRRLDPTSDVAGDWTPSTGADNYAMIDDATQDGDSTYIETNVVDTEDQYEIGNLPAGVNSIIAVVRCTVARAPNGGAPLVAHTLEIDATKATGDGLAVGTTAFRTQQTTFLTAPDASALSESKVNSARVGVKAV